MADANKEYSIEYQNSLKETVLKNIKLLMKNNATVADIKKIPAGLSYYLSQGKLTQPMIDEIADKVEQITAGLPDDVTLSGSMFSGKGKLANINKKTLAKLGAAALVVTAFGGAIVYANQNNGSETEKAGENATTPAEGIYAKNNDTFNINVNADEVDFASNASIANAPRGLNPELVDGEVLDNFMLVMNLNEWTAEDLSLRPGLDTDTETMDNNFRLVTGQMSEMVWHAGTKEELPDLGYIQSTDDRALIEEAFNIVLQYNTGDEAARKDAVKKNNELIERIYGESKSNAYSPSTMYFLSLILDKERVVTINAGEGLVLVSDDYFKIISTGISDVNEHAGLPADDNFGDNSLKGRAAQERLDYMRDLEDKLDLAASYKGKTLKETAKADKREYDTQAAVNEQIDEKLKAAKYEEMPDLATVANKYDVTYQNQEPSNADTSKIDANGQYVRNTTGPSQEQVNQDLENKNNNAPITPGGNVTKDPDGNFDYNVGSDDKVNQGDHDITLNPGGGIKDPSTPDYDKGEAEDNKDDKEETFEPLPDNNGPLYDENGNVINPGEGGWDVSNSNSTSIVEMNGKKYYYENGNLVPVESELSQAEKDAIEAADKAKLEEEAKKAEQEALENANIEEAKKKAEQEALEKAKQAEQAEAAKQAPQPVMATSNQEKIDTLNSYKEVLLDAQAQQDMSAEITAAYSASL